jgi:hypothetical protein
MKTPVAVTLIIMGALLIMVPVQADYMHQRNLVEVMNEREFMTVTLGGSMTTEYRFGCWATGSAMIAIAILRSLVKNSTPSTEN